MKPLYALILIGGLAAPPIYGQATRQAQDVEPAVKSDSIVFNDVDDALTRATELDKPLVLYFTADWCGYCRRMETESFSDDDVVREAREFEWAKIDIDDNQPLAARFAVRGVPAFVFLNPQGQMLDQANGYMPSARFLQVLETMAEKKPAQSTGPTLQTAKAKLEELQKLTGEQWNVAAAALLDHLALPQEQGRESAQQALLGTGERAYPLLLNAMGSDRLALRAAAHDLLVTGSGRTLAFDPFASAEQREAQLSTWRQALRSPATQPAPLTSSDSPDG